MPAKTAYERLATKLPATSILPSCHCLFCARHMVSCWRILQLCYALLDYRDPSALGQREASLGLKGH
jgi:hypothetical protein